MNEDTSLVYFIQVALSCLLYKKDERESHGVSVAGAVMEFTLQLMVLLGALSLVSANTRLVSTIFRARDLRSNF